MSGKEFHIRRADFFAFPIYYKNRTLVSLTVNACNPGRVMHLVMKRFCVLLRTGLEDEDLRASMWHGWQQCLSQKVYYWYPANCRSEFLLEFDSVAALVALPPVDLTGNVHMMWELVLGGMELGTPNALTPTPSKHAECSELMSSVSCYEMLIQMCFVFR